MEMNVSDLRQQQQREKQVRIAEESRKDELRRAVQKQQERE
jgi:hypothetical protein